MIKTNNLFYVIFLLLASCTGEVKEFSTDAFTLFIDDSGQISGLVDKQSGRDYLVEGQEAHVLSIRVGDKVIRPSAAQFENNNSELLLLYDSVEVAARVKVEAKGSHITFELMEVLPLDGVELVIWGPYPTAISEVIGETVGVVRNDDFAVGLQALNPKTLGGYPWNENDCMPQLDIFEGEDYSDLSEEGKRYVLYRVEAAKPENFGSTLQAYCRNRTKDRVIVNWNHDRYLAPAFDDGGVIGSRIALFGCPVNEALDYIGEIERKEGLPHPMVAGEWGKKAQAASSAYMILGFGEEEIQKAIDYTKKAGLNYLYHPGPFETWGQFQLNSQFPSGWDGLKACVDQASEQDVYLGVHTLSNFITPNDAYVTPTPDKRLAKVGSSQLTNSIDAQQKEIEIVDPEFFLSIKNNNLHTVVIGDELIQYKAVTENSPWMLQDCKRGAFGTLAASHEKNSNVSLLADHGYKVFLSDADLTMEIATTLARLFNETGIRQISFDGLEGNRSTGMGNYGEILMTSTWYENLDPDITAHFIADASRTSHYFWHIYSRMNWGEPWYAGFRESQTEYRFKNQAYFQRNLMPGMLGWFLMTEQTSLEDIEWMLAKAAGYNAGFGFVSSFKAFEGNGLSDDILQQIRIWEQARMQQVFDSETLERLKNIDKEFHLEKVGDKEWELSEISAYTVEHEQKDKQPGEPLFSKLAFNTNTDGQSIDFILSAIDGSVNSIKLEIDNFSEIVIPVILHPGETIKSVGGNTIIHYDKNWNTIRELSYDPVILSSGEHSVTVDCAFRDGEKSKLKLEMRIPGKVEKIISK